MKLLNRYHTPISFAAGLFFVITVFALTGCAAGSNARLPDPGTLPAADSGGLPEGRALYLTECATCHNRIWPDERTPERWQAILERHSGRLSVSAGSYNNVVSYILRASEPPPK